MEKEKSPPSSTAMVPLRLLNPDLHVTHHNRQLAVATSSSFAEGSKFGLPSDWTVRLALRSDGSRVDKYYYEPYTNRMFRSIREVEKYLNGEEYTPQHRSPGLGSQPRLTMGGFGSEKMIVSGGRLLRLEENDFDEWQLAVVRPPTSESLSPFNLPDGWVVEMRPRKGQGCDKYYYEPGTGQKFRSLAAVERHLQADKRESAPVSRILEMGNYGEDYNLKKRRKMGASPSDFTMPPNKIKWVLKNSGGLVWNPIVGESFVPEPVKNQWSFKFMQLTSEDSAAPDVENWES